MVGRHECERCGSHMKQQGRRQNPNNGHHWTVFYCGECDREVLRG